MSTNCIRCVVEKRTGNDLLCGNCREHGQLADLIQEQTDQVGKMLISIDALTDMCAGLAAKLNDIEIRMTHQATDFAKLEDRVNDEARSN